MSDLLARGWPLLVALAVAGLAALALAAAVDRRDLAFSPGVPITRVATDLYPGETACQRRIFVRERFEAIELVPRWLDAPGPPLVLTVRSDDPTRRLTRVPVSGGYADNRPLRVEVGPMRRGAWIDVCLTNPGRARVGIEGGEAESVPTSPLFVNGVRNDRSALALRFLGRPRSVASQVPVIFERAALFRPAWVGPWTFWALALVVGMGVPALLARALAAARDEGA